MALTTDPNPEANLTYFNDGEFSYDLVAQFFDNLHATFATRSVNGGDIDRLNASMIMGRNSLFVHLDRREQSMKKVSEFVIEGENDRGGEMYKTVPFNWMHGETQAGATARWLSLVRDTLIEVVTLLVLPVQIDALPVPNANTSPPDNDVPESYVAPES